MTYPNLFQLPKINRNIALLAFLSLLTFNAYVAIRSPYYNWDMIAYIAVAISFSEHASERIHQTTYDIVEHTVPPDHFQDLVRGGRNSSVYRVDMQRNPDHFSAQLPFYSVKPAYPALIYFLGLLGLNLVTASVLISVISYSMLSIIVFSWMWEILPPFMALASSAITISLSFMFDIARYSTPDALSTLVIIMSMFLYMERRSILASFSLMALSILVRPDNVILCGIFFLYAALFDRTRHVRTLSVLFLPGSMALYLSSNLYHGGYDWGTLFQHAFIGWLTDPLHAPRLGFRDYVRAYMSSINQSLLLHGNKTLFFLLSLLALASCMREPLYNSRYIGLLAVSTIYIFVHFAVFPESGERFFASSYLLILLTLARSIAGRRSAIPIAPALGSAAGASAERSSSPLAGGPF